jgi:hypothetical protein
MTTGGGLATSPIGAASVLDDDVPLAICATGPGAAVPPPVATTISWLAVDARLAGVSAGPTAAPISTPEARTTAATAPKERRPAGDSTASDRSGTRNGSSPRRSPQTMQ